MGAKAVELLLEGKSARVIGVKGNELFDMDIDEALSLEKDFDKGMYNLTKILSI